MVKIIDDTGWDSSNLEDSKDLLIGGYGSDILYGNGGDDDLYGGRGLNLLYGGRYVLPR